jgi:hypothetical protein
LAKAKSKTRAGTKRGSGKRTRRVASAKRIDRATAGPSLPLRDIIRGGMPRSPKAPGGHQSGPPTPWGQRRMKTAHGLRSGATLVQSPSPPRGWFGLERPDLHKR